MFPIEFNAVAGMLVGLCATVLSVGLLATRRLPARVSGVLATSVEAALAAAAGAAWFCFSSASWAAALAVLALVWLVGWGLRPQRPGQAMLRYLGTPSFQIAFLMFVGLGVILASAVSVGRAGATAAPEIAVGPRPVDIVPAAEATTDAGTRLPLFEPSSLDRSRPPTESESPHLLDHVIAFQVLRTAQPDPASNCHGWVFTGGTFWIRGDEVQIILEENGYEPVRDPRPNDLIVYFDKKGKVAHLGLVRSAAADGLILIESKWGGLGRYVHVPEGQGYAPCWRYYRSARPGHLLRGEYRNYSPDNSRSDKIPDHGT